MMTSYNRKICIATKGLFKRSMERATTFLCIILKELPPLLFTPSFWADGINYSTQTLESFKDFDLLSFNI